MNILNVGTNTFWDSTVNILETGTKALWEGTINIKHSKHRYKGIWESTLLNPSLIKKSSPLVWSVIDLIFLASAYTCKRWWTALSLVVWSSHLQGAFGVGLLFVADLDP